MRAALDLADAIGLDAILTMHRVLMGDDDTCAGRLRKQQVWIGGSSVGPHEAVFVPPHHTRVPAALKDLVKFMARTDLPVLAHAALAHAQFETIHPFADGNGHTGRALIHAMVKHAGLTRRLTVPLSAGLLHNVDAYFASLTKFRAGNPEAVIKELSDAVFASLANARELLGELRGIRQGWVQVLRARSDSAVWKAVDVIIAQPVIDVAHLVQALGVSTTAASSAIELLVQSGVLHPLARKRRRNRIWQSSEVLDALDAFAMRAGPRTVSAG